ncbi:hypothetical protein [Egbenema bharatensis]|uniref:hypothetical protein n=1 Tax=Egbenema bharatensis TaxID=3463334 RepID=UPI003A897EC5
MAPDHSALIVLVEPNWLSQTVNILRSHTDRVSQKIVTRETVNQLLDESES